VQIQPGPAIQPGGMPPNGKYYPPGQIVVREGTPEKYPTFYHGALRIRLLPVTKAMIAIQPRQEGEVLFLLEVTPEPRLQGFSIVGSPRVDKAVDDLAQELSLAMEPMGVAGQPFPNQPGYINIYNPGGVRQVALRLKLGQKQAKTISNLTGNLAIQALSPKAEALITVENVMAAAGKTARGQDGGSIEVLSIVKQADGSYRVSIRFDNPPQFLPGQIGAFNGANGGVVVMQANVGVAQVQGPNGGPATSMPGNKNAATGLPVLVDANGKALELTQIPQRLTRVADGKVVQEITLVFQPANGAGEPARMVLFGHRMVSAQVPFQFHNVQLPQ
jgi:hypothetical protein